MDDWSSLLNTALSFLAGLGLTGLFVAIYESRVRRKERAREYFRELVLTPDLLRFQNILTELYYLLHLYQSVAKGEAPLAMWHGSFVTIRDLPDLFDKVKAVMEEIPPVSEKLRETGFFILAPPKVGTRIMQILLAMKTLAEFAKNKVPSQTDLSEPLEELSAQLQGLSEDIRGILGIEKL